MSQRESFGRRRRDLRGQRPKRDPDTVPERRQRRDRPGDAVLGRVVRGGATDRDVPRVNDGADAARSGIGRKDSSAVVEEDRGQSVRSRLRPAAQHVRPREVGDELRRGRRDELRGRPRLDERPVHHHADPVAERGRVGEVVRDHERRQREPAQRGAELRAHVHPRLRVERRERLVEEQDGRVSRERARESNTLALAAGELTRPRRGEVGDPERLEQLGSRPASAERDVPLDRQVRKERVVLEHEPDGALLGRKRSAGRRVEPDLLSDANEAVLRLEQARDGTQDGRLAGARRPDERERLAPDLELER